MPHMWKVKSESKQNILENVQKIQEIPLLCRRRLFIITQIQSESVL